MAKSNDWLPSSRQEQLAMARTWISVLAEDTASGQGAAVKKWAAWGIPQAAFTQLGALYGAAQAALTLAMQAETRTPVANQNVRDTFGALIPAMRDMKNRYFFVPPLTNGDIVSLLLRLHDNEPTKIPPPTAQVEADLTFPGIHLVELRNIRPVAGQPPDPRSDYGVRVYFGFSGPPTEKYRYRLAEPPKTGGDLKDSLFTRRKKEFFDFEGESGNTVYFCLRYENPKGDAGPYGPIMKAVIP